MKLILIFFNILMIVFPEDAHAFSKLKNGFETITRTYLIPLSHAVAGAAFIYYIILSLVRPEENQKKAGQTVILSFFIGGGLELINQIIQSFS